MMIENCMQSIPLAVLKPPMKSFKMDFRLSLHAIHTACGIETGEKPWCFVRSSIACNPYRLRYFFYFSVRFFQTAAFFMA